MQQVRSLQVLETVNLMAGGFPHRYSIFKPIYLMSLQFIGGQFKKQTTTASPHCPYLTFPFSPTFSTVFSSITPFLTRRMRFKNFNSIYWMLAPIKILSRNEELAFDDCKRILDYLKGSLEQQVPHHHQRD